MKPTYAIPAREAGLLDIGQWVEIFEAYGDADGTRAIRVKSMRIEGRTLTFTGGVGKSTGSRALRPHEGRVAFVERDRNGTRFGIRLRS